jgi:transcriptional regulator with XRE-family HTH domain
VELIRTADDLVTRVALVRSMRGLTHAKLAERLMVDPVTVLHWERGQDPLTPALCKRLGLALRWQWTDFMLPAIPHDDAWQSLVQYRQAAAKAE